MSAFVNYRRDHCSLEDRLSAVYAELNVSLAQREEIVAFMAPLREKGPVYRFHYDHSIRVALLGVEVAKFIHLDPRVSLRAGLLHDIGKVHVPIETLGKMNGWTNKDTIAMKPHVIRGYEMIRGKFDFAASVMIWHHRFQTAGYPGTIPKDLHPYSLGTKAMIMWHGRLLSLCDQFDALHRVNDKNGEMAVPTGEGIKKILLEKNVDQSILINELYEADIFTLYVQEPVLEAVSS